MNEVRKTLTGANGFSTFVLLVLVFGCLVGTHDVKQPSQAAIPSFPPKIPGFLIGRRSPAPFSPKQLNGEFSASQLQQKPRFSFPVSTEDSLESSAYKIRIKRPIATHAPGLDHGQNSGAIDFVRASQDHDRDGPPLRADLASRWSVPIGEADSLRTGNRAGIWSPKDLEIDNMVLLATIDGAIHAINRDTGEELWSFMSNQPMVETVHRQTHGFNVSRSKILSNAAENDGNSSHRRGDQIGPEDYIWMIEPSHDAAIYIFSPDPDWGLQRLGLSVRQLAELSPYASEDSPFVYTAQKRNVMYTLDATDGTPLKYFSPNGAYLLRNDHHGDCKPLSGFESSENGPSCATSSVITLGRTEYTIGIQNAENGETICMVKYMEWTPNVRDRDLQEQYIASLDRKYIYSQFDGGVFAIEHPPTDLSVAGLKSKQPKRPLYHTKFSSSPVAQVFDVVHYPGHPLDHRLIVLVQPIPPNLPGESLNHPEWAVTQNSNTVFINRTEQGAWYAMSEIEYPYVTIGASKAKCYFPNRPEKTDLDADLWSSPHRDGLDLVGLHFLAPRLRVPVLSDLPRLDGPHRGMSVVRGEKNLEVAQLDNKLDFSVASRGLDSFTGRWSKLLFFLILIMVPVPLLRWWTMTETNFRGSFRSLHALLSTKTSQGTGYTELKNEPLSRLDIKEQRGSNPPNLDGGSVQITDQEANGDRLGGNASIRESSSSASDKDDAACAATEKADGGGENDWLISHDEAKRKVKAPELKAAKTKKGQDGVQWGKSKRHSKDAKDLSKELDLHKKEISISGSGVGSGKGETLMQQNLLIFEDRILGHGSGGTTVYEGTFEVSYEKKRHLMIFSGF